MSEVDFLSDEGQRYSVSLRSSSHFDFYVNATGQFQLHQSVDGLGGCTVNVQQSLVPMLNFFT